MASLLPKSSSSFVLVIEDGKTYDENEQEKG